MRTATKKTKVYKFKELTADQQDLAVANLADINVDFEWWDSVYEDAKNVLLKITSFDIDRGSYCKVELFESSEATAHKIIENHGKDCETYKTAQSFLTSLTAATCKKCASGSPEDCESDCEAKQEEVKEDFLRSISEDYRIMLQKEYEYMTSREAIVETIEANEYEFTADLPPDVRILVWINGPHRRGKDISVRMDDLQNAMEAPNDSDMCDMWEGV